jgi:hypothetical protein
MSEIISLPSRKNGLAGQHSRNGKLLILRSIPHTNRCVVRCDWCGKTRTMIKNNVRKSRSCGCKRLEYLTQAATRHGLSYSPEYRIWVSVFQRCYNPKSEKFHLYGARGIRVDRRFSGKHGFSNFIRCIGPRPTPQHSIDRIRVNENYKPGNVRWATVFEQRHNQRRVLAKAA